VDFASLKYVSGFASHVATEALPGALPEGQNSPQKCPYGLYAEQLSGTAFTAPRASNRRSWLYRIKPTVCHEKFKREGFNPFDNDFDRMESDPAQMRWAPVPLPAANAAVNFVSGISTFGGVGAPALKSGLAIYHYACNADMGDTAFSDGDGELLIVPQQGALRIRSEMGLLHVQPNEILVVPRGIKFSVDVDLKEGEEGARGYILELFEGALRDRWAGRPGVPPPPPPKHTGHHHQDHHTHAHTHHTHTHTHTHTQGTKRTDRTRTPPRPLRAAGAGSHRLQLPG
jgi:homogentisate 1,2-dioxygenase